MSQSKDIQFN